MEINYKDILKKTGRIVLSLACILLALLLVSTIINQILVRVEKDKFPTYGQRVEVQSGEFVNVYTQGSGAQTIVFLPGLSAPSPRLEYARVIDSLSSQYRVVVVEPLGYGGSDQTSRPRSLQNIADELHTCLQKLGIARYSLMGHSISGVYIQYYVSLYAQEVTAFIGLDTSVPLQIEYELPSLQVPGNYLAFMRTAGIFRWFPSMLMSSEDAKTYTKDELQQYRTFVNRTFFNTTVYNEQKMMGENFTQAQSITLPPELPVLFLLAAETVAMTAKYNLDWTALHQALVANSQKAQVLPLAGSHYFYRTQYAAIRAEVDAFLAE